MVDKLVNDGQTVFRDEKGRLLPGSSLGKPWQPGQSGNPGGGRPAEASLKRWLDIPATDKALLREFAPDLTDLDVVALRLAAVAKDPTHPAWAKAVAMVFDRTDGGVPKKLQLEGSLPLKVIVQGEREG